MTRIRVGVLSFAHDHAVFWSEAFRRDPAADLAGIWDDDVNRGEAAAQRHGCPFEPDLERLLDRVDAVAITSETAWHPALVERASARGKAILCEKPIAVDLAGLDAIEAAVAAAGVPFMQSFPKRFDPVNAELKALVDSGASDASGSQEFGTVTATAAMKRSARDGGPTAAAAEVGPSSTKEFTLRISSAGSSDDQRAFRRRSRMPSSARRSRMAPSRCSAGRAA